MRKPTHKKKTYTLTVFNHASDRFETVVVTEEVFRTYKRTKWNIEDNNASFFEHEIQFSSLIGGNEDAFQNFQEFIDTENTPERVIERNEMIAAVHKAISSLPPDDRELVAARFFNGMTVRQYAKLKGVPRSTIYSQERCILKKLKKIPEFKK